MDLEKIERDIASMESMKGDNKLNTAKSIYAEINRQEMEIAMDFNVSVYQIRKLMEFIPIVQSTISRIEAGAKRRKSK